MTADENSRVVTVFRSRLRSDAESNGYSEVADRMEERARAMPGFLEFKTFTAGDGEQVSIFAFDSLATHDAWRTDPEHRTAQKRGRDDFYAEYSITVTAELRRHSYP